MNDEFDGYLDAVTYIERELQKLGRTGKVDFGEKFSIEDITDFGEAVNYGTFKIDIPENIPLTEALESNIKSFLKSKSKTFEDAILNINAKLGDKAYSSELWKKIEPETVIRLSDAINKYDFRLDTNEPLESNINRFLETYDELEMRFNTAKKNESPESIVASLIEYASKQRIIVPEKTQDRWKELINSGEKIENIKGYIDNYSRSIGLPHASNEIENRNQYIKDLSEISQKTGVNVSVIHSISQECIRDSFKVISQFNDTLKKLPEMGNDYFSMNNYSKACCGIEIESNMVRFFQDSNLSTDAIKAHILRSSMEEFSKDPENFIKKMGTVKNEPVVGNGLESNSSGEKNNKQERGMNI